MTRIALAAIASLMGLHAWATVYETDLVRIPADSSQVSDAVWFCLINNDFNEGTSSDALYAMRVALQVCKAVS